MKCNHYIIAFLILISCYSIFTSNNIVIEGARSKDCGKLKKTALKKCQKCIKKGFKKTDCKNQYY